jgi:hypothetical protein
MKSEKGKPVFPDDADVILTEKIVEHTQKNTDCGDSEKGDDYSFEPPHRNRSCTNMSKSKCIALCIVLVLAVTGIVVFFIFKSDCCGKKKRGFFRLFR